MKKSLLHRLLVLCLLTSATLFNASAETPTEASASSARAPAAASDSSARPNEIPDVWDRRLPPAQVGSIRAYRTEPGAIIVEWRDLSSPPRTRALDFATGKEIQILDKESRQGERAYRLESGIVAKVTVGSTGKLVLDADTEISVQPYRYWDCWRGPDRTSIVKTNSVGADRQVIWHKYIFALLDRPEIFSVGLSNRCPEGRFPRLVSYTREVAGGFLPLGDGTFLLIDQGGLILRFDSDLNSKSELLGREVFVLAGGEPGTGVMLSRINGKTYYPERPPARYQQALDDLKNYLEQQREGKKK